MGLLVGFLEAFGASWLYEILVSYKNISVKATLSFMAANFVPLLIACGIWFSADSTPTKVYTGFIALIVGWLLGLAITHYYLMKQMRRYPGRWTSVKDIWWECAFGNICRLRARIQPVIGKIPFVWVILIKFFVPHVLIVLFLNLCASENGAGNYEDYAIRPYQILGLLTFIFAIFLFFIGLLVPEIYEPLALPQTKDYSYKEQLEERLFGRSYHNKDVDDDEEEISSKSSSKMDPHYNHRSINDPADIKQVYSGDDSELEFSL